jgi:uncharacterized DUF497 family protein
MAVRDSGSGLVRGGGAQVVAGQFAARLGAACHALDNVYTLRYDLLSQVLNNDPLDLDYEVIDVEERYRSVGLTNGGRFLRVAWTVRNGKIRAVTAFRARASNKKAFLEKHR